MGGIRTYICDDCGYEISFAEGIGMMYPLQCADALNDIKNGKEGEDIKAKALELKYPAASTGFYLFECEKCGNLAGGKSLDLYERKDDLPRKWNFKLWDVPFVANEHEGDTLVFEKAPICNNCNEKMSIKNPENGRGDYNVKCPVCKNELKESKSKHIFFD